MRSKIAWTILSNVLGSEKATQVVVFIDALRHFRGYYEEAMECRVRFFSQVCVHCRKTHPTDAKFCPQCGEEILSEEEQTAAAWREETALRDGIVASEEATAWAERRRDLEMVHH